MRILASCCAALLIQTAAALAQCRPAAFMLEADWYGGVTVPAAIAGRSLRLLVDTGGANSMLTDTTVTALGLPRQPIRARITMYGGLRIDSQVRIDGVEVGGVAAAPATFYVLPDNRIPYALSGTLAPDFLSRYDVEIDFARARINLYPPGCAPIDARAAVGFSTDGVHHVIAPVEVDGRTVPALIDTGASRSDFSLETAQELFGPCELKQATGADVEDGLYTHPFRTLRIGALTVGNPDLVLVPDRIARRPANSPRLVLGMGVLRRSRMVVAYSRGLLMLAPP